jgi:hypothetical protein
VDEGDSGGKLGKMFGDTRQFHIRVYSALRYNMYARLVRDESLSGHA